MGWQHQAYVLALLVLAVLLVAVVDSVDVQQHADAVATTNSGPVLQQTGSMLAESDRVARVHQKSEFIFHSRRRRKRTKKKKKRKKRKKSGKKALQKLSKFFAKIRAHKVVRKCRKLLRRAGGTWFCLPKCLTSVLKRFNSKLLRRLAKVAPKCGGTLPCLPRELRTLRLGSTLSFRPCRPACSKKQKHAAVCRPLHLRKFKLFRSAKYEKMLKTCPPCVSMCLTARMRANLRDRKLLAGVPLCRNIGWHNHFCIPQYARYLPNLKWPRGLRPCRKGSKACMPPGIKPPAGLKIPSCPNRNKKCPRKKQAKCVPRYLAYVARKLKLRPCRLCETPCFPKKLAKYRAMIPGAARFPICKNWVAIRMRQNERKRKARKKMTSEQKAKAKKRAQRKARLKIILNKKIQKQQMERAKKRKERVAKAKSKEKEHKKRKAQRNRNWQKKQDMAAREANYKRKMKLKFRRKKIKRQLAKYGIHMGKQIRGVVVREHITASPLCNGCGASTAPSTSAQAVKTVDQPKEPSTNKTAHKPTPTAPEAKKTEEKPKFIVPVMHPVGGLADAAKGKPKKITVSVQIPAAVKPPVLPPSGY